ncbi:MAG: hypothetical protein KDD85_01090 [Parvularculaceae bacterium]|nr:hypothetical protein [Parvularculaceae bacterium]
MARRIFAVLAALALPGCVEATIAWTNLKPDGPVAAPALSYQGVEDWEANGAPQARAQLQRHVYGFMPDRASSRVIGKITLNEDAFGGAGLVEEYRIGATMTYGGREVETVSRDGADGFFMDVVSPKGEGPFPVILMETFCPRWSTIPDRGVAGAPEKPEKRGGFSLGTYIFGRYICTPPIEEILSAGYAVATIFPSEFIPDEKEEGLRALARLTEGYSDNETRLGAIGAWGWAYSRMIDILETDPRFDKSAMIAWGHSRYAKAALVAAAFDARIDGVIAHQSGTGGASLNAGKKGESIKGITGNYPHWFARSYAQDDLSGFDQHMLLALIAPRPILLGNARRDVWSDPNGAFRAARGADPVYALYGSRGLDQPRLKPYDPAADIAFWIRPGTHGVVKEDWPAFLDFLNAHFAPKVETNGGRDISAGRK